MVTFIPCPLRFYVPILKPQAFFFFPQTHGGTREQKRIFLKPPIQRLFFLLCTQKKFTTKWPLLQPVDVCQLFVQKISGRKGNLPPISTLIVVYVHACVGSQGLCYIICYHPKILKCPTRNLFDFIDNDLVFLQLFKNEFCHFMLKNMQNYKSD